MIDEGNQAAVSTPTVVCVGCGGHVPDVGGPTHAYMLASPGCWRVYGEWMASRAYSPAGGAVAGTHHVDCYAVQHPGNADADRRQRQSVAVHLISLCLLIEFEQPAARANATRSSAGAIVLPGLGIDDWPFLEPPLIPAEVTIVDVASAPEGTERAAVARWIYAAWSQWAEHHETVRAWAELMVPAA